MQRQMLLVCSQLLFILGTVYGTWQYKDAYFDHAQYAKLYGQATGDNPTQEQMGPFQYQYVDHQPKCEVGGQPVCATNGESYFRFENDCKLEAHNMKMLFQYGTELEPTDLERCMPQCESIQCTTQYKPVCAAAESGPHQGQGVTYANECEVRRRECTSKETQRILSQGPCNKPYKRSRGKRRHGKHRRRGTTSTSTSITTITTAATPHTKKKSRSSSSSLVTPAHRFYMLVAPPNPSPPTTTTTTPVPIRFQEFRNRDNPDVSIAQAINAYSIYNIPDVGKDYDQITDSNLSLYLPGIGTVTDTPPKTTTTTTTTEPTMATIVSTTTTTTTPATTTSTTTATTTSKAKDIVNFIYVPFGTTSTTTPRTNRVVAASKRNLSSMQIRDNGLNSTRRTRTALLRPIISISKHARSFEVNGGRRIQKRLALPLMKPKFFK